MYCEKCGNQLRDGAKFCQKCGKMQNESQFTHPALQAKSGFGDSSNFNAEKPNKLKKKLPIKKVAAMIISLVIMAVGSVGLIIDFSVVENKIDTSLAPMYRAYQSVLEKNRNGILKLENEFIKDNISSTLITFTDIVGDEKDELIFLACDNYEMNRVGVLHIFSFVDGSEKEIFSDTLDIYAGQGLQPFMLFTMQGSKTLWLYRQMIDETETTSYFEYIADYNLNLTQTERLKRKVPTEGLKDYYQSRYYKNGIDCSKNEFDSEDDYYHANIENVILVGAKLYDEEFQKIVSERYKDECYVYSAAIHYLNKYSGEQTEINNESLDESDLQNASPFTAKRIVFGLLAILGLGGSSVSMIVIVVSKHAALTIITIIVYTTTSIGAVGGVAYSAVKNEVFVSSVGTAHSINADTDSIPSCEGMSADKAQQLLKSSGYSVKTEYAYSSTVPKDSVISQRTEEGTVFIIVIVVSRGPEKTDAPTTEKSVEKTTEKPSEKPTEIVEAPEGYSQKLTVTAAKGSSYATAVLCEWKNGKWKKTATYDATVGSNGIGDTIEGHRITPQGTHKLGVVLYSGSVNTNMNTYRVSSSTCVIDDPNSKYYNQIMDKSDIPKGTHYDNIGKGLSDGTTYATIYIEHNGSGLSSKNVVSGKGSAIGVRGQYGKLQPNLGDVDISADDMRDLLSKLDANKHPMIEIKVK